MLQLQHIFLVLLNHPLIYTHGTIKNYSPARNYRNYTAGRHFSTWVAHEETDAQKNKIN